ncbi:MAG TPA: M20 family metallo-hydrolase [Paludibacteraceae bacterium]|nr:M20 family metallo-hydrolase [Paludibacteraceae bacterium]HQF50027.1 M20 family metallo-hydrolase [Paludibacteraceae bacterium]
MDIKQAQADAISLLELLVAIPSYSREEGAASDFLQNYIEALGYTTGRKDNNIWVFGPAFDMSKPTIMLNAHIDTVKPTVGWKYDPHVPTLEDGRLYGLGTNDDGASLVSLLYVFFMLTEKEQPYNLIFAASAEEEVSGKAGMESLLQELPPIDLAVVGEPTNMNLAVAEKGLMVVDCTAVGKSGHAARNEGVNAIYKALEDIEWVKNTELPKVSELLGPVKMTVTMVHAGTQHNVIPDKCTFVIDVRSNECYTNEEIFNILEHHMQSELQARSFRLRSSGIELTHPFVKKCTEMGISTFGSPTLSDQALMHFTSVKIGPGDSSRSHTADEYIVLTEIEEAMERYMQLLDGLKIN